MKSKTDSSKKKDFRPRYSGRLSKEFWDRVNAIPRSEGLAVYSLGCALQDLEGRVLTTLANAERKRYR